MSTTGTPLTSPLKTIPYPSAFETLDGRAAEVFSLLLKTEKMAPTATTSTTIPITRLRVVLSGPFGDLDDMYLFSL